MWKKEYHDLGISKCVREKIPARLPAACSAKFNTSDCANGSSIVCNLPCQVLFVDPAHPCTNYPGTITDHLPDTSPNQVPCLQDQMLIVDFAGEQVLPYSGRWFVIQEIVLGAVASLLFVGSLWVAVEMK
jgi:hypothetical protein